MRVKISPPGETSSRKCGDAVETRPSNGESKPGIAGDNRRFNQRTCGLVFRKGLMEDRACGGNKQRVIDLSVTHGLKGEPRE